jgi:hypothetical protein
VGAFSFVMMTTAEESGGATYSGVPRRVGADGEASTIGDGASVTGVSLPDVSTAASGPFCHGSDGVVSCRAKVEFPDAEGVAGRRPTITPATKRQMAAKISPTCLIFDLGGANPARLCGRERARDRALLKTTSLW